MKQTLSSSSERLRLGFVGGSLESGIGNTHRYAAHLDNHYALVAGVFSSDAKRNAAAGAAYGIAADRLYSSAEAMAVGEAARDDGIDVVAIMTPNAHHVPASLCFLQHGIDVICEKPLATRLEDALTLERMVARTGLVFVLTHNYSGFPMVREARARVAAGALGAIRLVQVEFAVASGVMPGGQPASKQMSWRLNPEVVGTSAVLADVGSHAHHLLRFVTGLEVESVCAELSTLVAGRMADDNAHVMLRLSNQARGTIWASFVAAGHRQGLGIRVFGATGSMAWHQEDPDRLLMRPQDAPHHVLRRGELWLGDSARASTRLKAGQVEGQLEAFANLYSNAAELVKARRAGTAASAVAQLCPNASDGVAGMRFIESCVRSHANGSRWESLSGAGTQARTDQGEASR